nr:unnamed protein product [Callosobruchus analis]
MYSDKVKQSTPGISKCKVQTFSASDKPKPQKENLLDQATKMLRTSKKKFPGTQIGNTVRTKVLDVDRGPTDPRNVFATIVENRIQTFIN